MFVYYSFYSFYYLCLCSVTVILLHCGSFCHENKFLVCVNIPGNKAHSESDSDPYFYSKGDPAAPQHHNLKVPGTQSFFPFMASKAQLKWPLLQQPQLHQPHTSHSSKIKVFQCTHHYMVVNPSSLLCLQLNILSCPSILQIQSLVPKALNQCLQHSHPQPTNLKGLLKN